MKSNTDTVTGENLRASRRVYRQFLADAVAFIGDTLDNESMDDSRKLALISTTLMHDANGLLAHGGSEGDFLPRVDGYASRLDYDSSNE